MQMEDFTGRGAVVERLKVHSPLEKKNKEALAVGGEEERY